MIQYGDLPHKLANGEVINFPGQTPVTSVTVDNTAHTEDLRSYKRPCRKCKAEVSIVVRKPGSPFIWCLECF